MKRPGTQQFAQAATCLMCVLLTLRATDGLDWKGTEFSGGWLTGPLLSLADVGTLLFLLAFVATFLVPRVAAGFGLAAAALTLPLFAFFFAPIPFADLFAPGHEFKVRPTPGLHWEKWTITGLLMLVLAAYVCVRSITRSELGKSPAEAQGR